jgi:hypothetical protein
MQPTRYWRDQTVALSLTIATCLFLAGAIWFEATLLNHVLDEKIVLALRPADILIGATIYLKTAIDFAIFIARLMDKNPGLKGRIGIEIGTALGNGIGTMAILLVWSFFKEVNWLLALMIIVASLVLLRLAQDTLAHNGSRSTPFSRVSGYVEKCLAALNKVTNPLLSRIVPSTSLKVEHKKTFLALLAMSCTVPFILGLDDFAGYVPLFNVVNVFSFSVGVLIGHMILNIALYISPSRTIEVVKNPVIALIGSLAFVGLAGWGLFEAFKLLFLHH